MSEIEGAGDKVWSHRIPRTPEAESLHSTPNMYVVIHYTDIIGSMTLAGRTRKSGARITNCRNCFEALPYHSLDLKMAVLCW